MQMKRVGPTPFMVRAAITILAVFMDVRIYLLIVNTAGIIPVTLPFDYNSIRIPFLLQTHRGCDTLVILQRIRRISFRIQIIDTEIENGLVVIPSKTLSKKE